MRLGNDSIDLKGLERMIKLLKKEKIAVKVGILGEAAARSQGGEDGEEGLNNATIGMWHEFGNENLPMRSWLRMPLNEKFYNNLKSAGAFDKKTMEKILKEKTFKLFSKKIGAIAVETIQEAFDSEGFGKWDKSDMSRKKNNQTLVETQQLRNSVTSEVVGD